MAITLNAELREKVGSRAARKMRANGSIPCSLQDPKAAVIAFGINEDEFLAARRAHENFFDIKIGKEDHPAVIRELAYDYLTDRIIHVEFQAVVRGVKVESEISLTFIGQPAGGVLNSIVDHVTVSSLPSMIPDTIEVMVATLGEGETLSASDLVMPEGCSLITAGDTTVAGVSGADASIEAGDEGETGEAGDVADSAGGDDTPAAE
ncbi:MAG: large subunit ribosomal protein L25 [Bacteroidia bacterium]|jgi:large subunit ribosomal protein L25